MAHDQGHDSRAVANRILEIAKASGIELTIMQLLKLTYFSHGWLLAGCGKPLTKDHAQAWQHGPVYPLVYRAAPRAGVTINGPICDPRTKVAFRENFDQNEVATMTEVVGGYGRMHAFLLSRLTHEKGSPWDRAYHELGPYADIPDAWIEQYFKSQRAA